MNDNIIKLNNDNVLRFKIADMDGIETGDVLEFDMEDIELALRYQDLLEQDKKNKQWIKNQLLIISKREDVKGKKLLSKNEEDGIKAMREFFNKEKEVYDMFLGKDGVNKFLHGRALGWETLEEIDKIIEEEIAPKLEVNVQSITDRIKEKYKVTEKEENVLE